MRRISFIVVVLVVSLVKITFAQCPNIIWQDEFEKSTLDTSRWSFQVGDGCEVGLCGWGNNELQWYQSDNVELVDGKLRIIAKKEDVGGKPYTSARIRSMGKADWTYGRFEASIKLPTGKGMWPAFWMLPTDEVYKGWPRSGEIDIVELVGSDPSEVHGTIHYGRPWPNNASLQGSLHLNKGQFQDEFHTFAVEWEEGEIRWFMDDYLYSTQRPEDLSPEAWPFDQRFHLIFNLAVGGSWPGNPDETTVFPQIMDIEYVRVYDGFFPSLSGPRKVEKNAKNLKYTINNAPENASFKWTIPQGAKLLGGQGTPEIILDWGESSGDLKVLIKDKCNSKEITLNVMTIEPVVKKQLVRVGSIENFDTPNQQMNFDFTSGAFVDAENNPAPDMINSSPLTGKYSRNKDNRYDVMVFNITDVSLDEFVAGDKQFSIDMYTTAPVGTEILVQLENSSIATNSNYPNGRHSRFHTFTTKENQWERLLFTLQDQPDASFDTKDIDKFVFLFAPNSNSGDTYYIDNFDVYAPKR